MLEILYRRLQAGDAPCLYDFWDVLSPASKRTFAPFGQHPRLDQYENVLRGNDPLNGDKFDLVAVAGDCIIGWGFVWALTSAEPVFGLGVADEHQGHGIGAGLMDAVLNAMDERHLPELYLTVVTDNQRAQRLYTRRGFVRYGAFIGEDGLPYHRMLRSNNRLSTRSVNMDWLNEPATWKHQNGVLTVHTAPKSDFWRKTHYGFVRDNGHFYGQPVTGDFVAEVKVSGNYHDLYDHAGLMVRLDEATWIKCGIEFFEGSQHVSAVVTRDYSDWSVIPAPHNPPALWLRVTRTGEAIEIKYSFDGQSYRLLRQAHLTEAPTLSAGPMCASPEGNGFDVTFEGFSIKQP